MRVCSGSCVAVVLGMVLAAPAPAADTWKADPVHSSIVFRIKHLDVGYIYGRFNQYSGSFAFDERDPAACALNIEVQAGSVDTGNAVRDGHLKGPDFFNVKEFPKITFKSTSMKALPGDAKNYEVTGDLTLHGVTKSVKVKLERIGTAKDMRGTLRTGFETTFTIKRSDYGMKYLVGALGDEVRVTVALEGIR